MAVRIALEGIDGSGKGTQAELLRQRCEANGLTAVVVPFPTYEKTLFGREVGHYLNGAFGPLDAVHPKLIAILYAGDRFENRDALRRLDARCDVVIYDRYVGSNIAHQAAKLPTDERPAFMEWIEHLEFGVFGLPRPHATVFLDLPPHHAQALVQKKAARSYTDRPMDLHEEDAGYLEATYAVYQTLSRRPGWITVDSLDSSAIKSIDRIHQDLWAALRDVLPLTRDS